MAYIQDSRGQNLALALSQKSGKGGVRRCSAGLEHAPPAPAHAIQYPLLSLEEVSGFTLDSGVVPMDDPAMYPTTVG